MPLIPYPNVPDAPGVPAVPRIGGAQATITAILGSLSGIVWNALQSRTQWGIYDKDGRALGDPSNLSGITNTISQTLGLGATLSTNTVDYTKEFKISDYPVEGGTFASYNKVETPATPIVKLCFSGNERERTAFINSIDAACASMDMYSVVTPEVRYINYNIERYTYARSASSGATMLTFEIYLRQVRQVSAVFTFADSGQIKDPKAPGAASRIDGGKVQPTTPKKSTLKRITESLGIQ